MPIEYGNEFESMRATVSILVVPRGWTCRLRLSFLLHSSNLTSSSWIAFPGKAVALVR